MQAGAIENRAAEAARLWQSGDAAQASGDLERAYRLFTQAHDLVTDCAKLHIQAHRRLKVNNRLRKNWGEYCTDTILLALAPFGMFELLAIFFRSRVGNSELCRRNG
jgi:hypothetical protein